MIGKWRKFLLSFRAEVLSSLNLGFQVPAKYDKNTLTDIIRAITNQVNRLSEGSISARYRAASAVPSGSAVSYVQGDIVWDSQATEQSTVGATYVRLGWVCTQNGSPGTFKEMRVVTTFPLVTGSPGGSDKQVQYNNAGGFGGSPNFTWDNTNRVQKTNGVIWADSTVGSTPTSGAGTRLMWIPAKAAFRAGLLGSNTTAWDDANVGVESHAIGTDSQASGVQSMVFGPLNTALSNGAVIVGSGNSDNAASFSVVLIGLNGSTTANADTALGISFGSFGVIVDAATALAIGTNFTLSKNNTIAIGLSAPQIQLSTSGNAVGTVSTTAGSRTVTGSGSLFLANLDYGDFITIVGEKKMVISVTNNTSLTVDQNFAATNSGVVYTIKSTPALFKSGAGSPQVLVSGDNRTGVRTGQTRTLMWVGGVIDEFIADVANGTTVETDIFSTTIIASTVNTDRMKLKARWSGLYAATANNKQIKVYFAGTAVFDSTALVIVAANSWDVDLLLIRTSSSTARVSVRFTSSSNVLLASITETDLTGLSWTVDNILKITAKGGATSDLTGKLGCVEMLPHAQ